MSNTSKAVRARMIQGVRKTSTRPPATRTSHSHGASIRCPEDVAAILVRDREVPGRRRHRGERDRPEDDRRDEQHEPDREREDQQVHERAPGREVRQGLQEAPERPALGLDGRRAGDGGAEEPAGDLALGAAGDASEPERGGEERQADDEDDQAAARRQEGQEDGEPGDAEREGDERVGGLLPGAEPERRGEEGGHGLLHCMQRLACRDGASPCPAVRAFPTCAARPRGS